MNTCANSLKSLLCLIFQCIDLKSALLKLKQDIYFPMHMHSIPLIICDFGNVDCS